jgi:phage shock protein A
MPARTTPGANLNEAAHAAQELVYKVQSTQQGRSYSTMVLDESLPQYLARLRSAVQLTGEVTQTLRLTQAVDLVNLMAKRIAYAAAPTETLRDTVLALRAQVDNMETQISDLEREGSQLEQLVIRLQGPQQHERTSASSSGSQHRKRKAVSIAQQHLPSDDDTGHIGELTHNSKRKRT